MKKVFSVKKFKECCKKIGLPKEEYEKSCELWANECDGLTKEEMRDLGYVTTDDWMIEVKVKKYYIELSIPSDDTSYVLQSKWFDTKEEAVKWAKENIDFVDSGYDLKLMFSIWNKEDDCYTDIYFEKYINIVNKN